MGMVVGLEFIIYIENPVLYNFFKQIGYAEELGSGSKKMYKYCPLLVADSYPEIVEEDVFKMRIWYESPQNDKMAKWHSKWHSKIK